MMLQSLKTARDFVRVVAELGGFLGRQGDGEPGWQTLWRGYQRLQDIVLGHGIKAGRVRTTSGELHSVWIPPS